MDNLTRANPRYTVDRQGNTREGTHMAAKLPPTIHELLDMPEFRAMMKTNPWIPPSMRWGNPWRLWALKDSGVWVLKEYPTYADAWRVALKAIRADYPDVAIVSKRFLVPPKNVLRRALEFRHPFFPWCPRCRRPTYYGAYTAKHHALRLSPVIPTDEPFFCYYCGIRKVFAQSINTRSV